MFRGEFSLTIDSKGRLAVPSRYRERLSEACGGKLVTTISLMNRCLCVYPFPQWQTLEDELKVLPALDRKAQSISHLLIGHASECDMDSHGRILVPQKLRKFAGLDKHVSMVGMVHRFELWDEAAWASTRDTLLGQVPDLLDEPSEALSSLVL
ncbi:MAG: cell division/cell wall cluster transcriptional repressor MraZ [Gammaproteobacteria bacterium]|nr:MAG: cell division/cell wall cluster transcriptional repressor MraZ [Gammaproteobacteria bacterium]